MSGSGYWICTSCRNIWPKNSPTESVRHVNCPNCGKNGDRDACIFYRSTYSEAQQFLNR